MPDDPAALGDPAQDLKADPVRVVSLSAVLSLLVAIALGCASTPTRVQSVQPAEPLRAGADVHVHLTMEDALFAFEGEVNGAALASSPDQTLVNQIRIEHLHRAGIRLIIAALWPWFDLRPGVTSMGETLRQVEALRALSQKYPELAIASSAAEARELISRGRIAVVPGIEGAEAIRSVDDVDVLYAAGVRVVGLVHFTDNAIADADDGQFGPVLGVLLDGKSGGLTQLGRDAVRRMIELGMLIDLSHSSERTRADVLELTEPAGVPVLYSHAGSDWEQVRTLDDAHARRIAASGGLIGIGIYRHDTLQPVPADEHWSGFTPESCDDVIAHWVHYARVAGAEAIVLGSDLNSVIHRGRPGGYCPEGLRHAGDLPYLFAGLEARGVPRTTLDDAADRVLRVLDAVERRASPFFGSGQDSQK